MGIEQAVNFIGDELSDLSRITCGSLIGLPAALGYIVCLGGRNGSLEGLRKVLGESDTGLLAVGLAVGGDRPHLDGNPSKYRHGHI